MTQAFCDMLYLFSCAVHGTEPESVPTADLREIQKEAVHQGVWPFVFTSVKSIAERGGLPKQAELIDEWNQQLLFSVMNHTRRNALAAETLVKLQQEGIPCCVLKGETLSALYALPQCRMSGDVDVLIPKALENRGCAVLRREGYELMSRGVGSPHVEAIHPTAGVLELHVSLYDNLCEEQWFSQGDAVLEEPREFHSEYGDFLQLGYTDGALFAFFHFVKHFLSSGGGIKQLTDALVYFASYAKELDWKRIEEKIVSAKCDRLFAHMIGVGICYLGFRPEQFPPADYDKALVDRLAEDLYERGGYARKSDENGEIRVPYLKSLLEEKGKDSEEYLQQKQRQNMMSLLFPRRKTMEANYPYVMKSPLLLPIAWIHRAFRFAFRRFILRKSGDESAAYHEKDRTQESQAKRLDLAKDLEMI